MFLCTRRCCALSHGDGAKIAAIYVTRNPDKLGHFDGAGQASGA